MSVVAETLLAAAHVAPDPSMDELAAFLADEPAPELTPESLTFDQIYDAITAGLVRFETGWDALDEPGAPRRGEARKKICDAIAKQRGRVS